MTRRRETGVNTAAPVQAAADEVAVETRNGSSLPQKRFSVRSMIVHCS